MGLAACEDCFVSSFIIVRVVPSVPWKQEVIDDEVAHSAAKSLTCGEVKAEVLAGKDPAQGRLLCGGRESGERTLYARQHLRSDSESETISFEKGNQHRRSDGGNGRVRAWVSRIRGRIGDLRQPSFVR